MSVVRGPVYFLQAKVSVCIQLLMIGTSVWDDLLSCACVPPEHAEESDKGRYADGVVHVCSRDGPNWREEQDHTDEAYPCNSNGVDRFAPTAHAKRSWMELDFAFVPSVRNNDSDIADVQCRGGDGEDAHYRQGASDANQV